MPDTHTTAEPWCNHDPVAVLNGVCECGEVVDLDPMVNLVGRLRELATQVIDEHDVTSELLDNIPAHRATPARLLADAVADLDQYCTEQQREGLLIDWPTP